MVSAPRTVPNLFFDLTLLFPALSLSLLGILTMSTFGQGASLAPRQLLWLLIAVILYLGLSTIDMSFIRRTSIVMALYIVSFALLTLLLLFASPVFGARAWFSLGPISFQPADLAKLALIALLAKYLSRRHVEIGDFRHIIVSGAYAPPFSVLFLLRPGIWHSIIFGPLWLGLVLFSGISKKHLAVIGLIGLAVASLLWFEGLKPYQRARIVSFVNP